MSNQGRVISVNISVEKGTVKHPVPEIIIDENGVVNDAHSGPWHRQVSLLAQSHIDFFSKEIYLEDVLEQEDWENANGEWTGLMVVESKGIPLLVETLEELSKKSDFKQMSMTHLLEALLKKTQIVVVYTKGGWIDIDDLADYHDAGMF